jgi:presenilin-like A22 family membrane protease
VPRAAAGRLVRDALGVRQHERVSLGTATATATATATVATLWAMILMNWLWFSNRWLYLDAAALCLQTGRAAARSL